MEEDSNDDGTGVFSDILDYERAKVQGKLLVAIHLMQEVMAKFQAGLSQ